MNVDKLYGENFGEGDAATLGMQYETIRQARRRLAGHFSKNSLDPRWYFKPIVF